MAGNDRQGRPHATPKLATAAPCGTSHGHLGDDYATAAGEEERPISELPFAAILNALHAAHDRDYARARMEAGNEVAALRAENARLHATIVRMQAELSVLRLTPSSGQSSVDADLTPKKRRIDDDDLQGSDLTLVRRRKIPAKETALALDSPVPQKVLEPINSTIIPDSTRTSPVSNSAARRAEPPSSPSSLSLFGTPKTHRGFSVRRDRPNSPTPRPDGVSFTSARREAPKPETAPITDPPIANSGRGIAPPQSEPASKPTPIAKSGRGITESGRLNAPRSETMSVGKRTPRERGGGSDGALQASSVKKTGESDVRAQEIQERKSRSEPRPGLAKREEKIHETVRQKDKRRLLHGRSCPCCEEVRVRR
ncbi:hypothetical protein HK405_014046 [Cladochytrium tenue]|nr:hypothetical protein HK405_014046 [Cladochytrium tenue]